MASCTSYLIPLFTMITFVMYIQMARVATSIHPQTNWLQPKLIYSPDTDLNWSLSSLSSIDPAELPAYKSLHAIDLTFPFVGYGPLLTLSIKSLFPENPILMLAPILGAGLDVVENTVISNILKETQLHNPEAGKTGGGFLNKIFGGK